MINGLDIERFPNYHAAVENDHAKGKAVLRADSRWVSGTKNEISVRRFPAFTTDEPKNMGGEKRRPKSGGIPDQRCGRLLLHRFQVASSTSRRETGTV